MAIHHSRAKGLEEVIEIFSVVGEATASALGFFHQSSAMFRCDQHLESPKVSPDGILNCFIRSGTSRGQVFETVSFAGNGNRG